QGKYGKTAEKSSAIGEGKPGDLEKVQGEDWICGPPFCVPENNAGHNRKKKQTKELRRVPRASFSEQEKSK
ncbi:unnamed protein product, partial [marine sediment metagenome]